MEDVGIFDEERDVERILQLFIEPDPIPKLSSDVAALQWQVIHHARVWWKWLVEPSNLPYFEYADDVEETILGRVAEIIGSEYFPPQETLRRLREISPFMSFLTMVALELVSRRIS
jgi:hypothetical protein